MGLDMYLVGSKYLSDWTCPEIKTAVSAALVASMPKYADKVQSVKFEVAYWRKANAIHKWFVDNVQDGEDDCREYYVSKEQLQALVNACLQVLDTPALAGELLPPQGGFFFGGTSIDDYYFADLRGTIKQLTPLLAEDDLSLYYTSSW